MLPKEEEKKAVSCGFKLLKGYGPKLSTYVNLNNNLVLDIKKFTSNFLAVKSGDGHSIFSDKKQDRLHATRKLNELIKCTNIEFGYGKDACLTDASHTVEVKQLPHSSIQTMSNKEISIQNIYELLEFASSNLDTTKVCIPLPTFSGRINLSEFNDKFSDTCAKNQSDKINKILDTLGSCLTEIDTFMVDF